MGLLTQLLQESPKIAKELYNDIYNWYVSRGYPESVAKRIASGDLDMSPRAIAARRELYPTELYHGSMQDIQGTMKAGYDDGLLFFTPDKKFANDWVGKGKMQTREGELEFFDRYRPQKQAVYEQLGSPKYGTPEYDEFTRITNDIYRQENNAFKTVYPVRTRLSQTLDPTDDDTYANVVKPIFERIYSGSIDPNVEKQLKQGAYLHYENPDVVKELKKLGYDSMLLSETSDQGLTTVAKFDPYDIKALGAAFDPEYTGPNILGSAAGTAGALGLLAAPEEAEAGFINRGGRTLLEAFHGSPYQFDRFDMSKIGTGEGAQAYGHGLYFADSEDVARNYRDMLSSSSEEMETAVWALGRMGNDREAAIKALETGKGLGMAGPQSLFDDAAKLLRDEADLSGSGALYRTEIDVTPESLLDWDKPLSEQSEAVREALQSESLISVLEDGMSVAPGARLRIDDEIEEFPKYFMETDSGSKFRLSESDLKNLVAQKENEISGKTIANAIATKVGGQREASRYLSDKGIKGIKYLDGNSRGAGDGTSNYVIFDDSLVNIADRYAIAPPMFAPSQDRALAAANQGLLDPLTVDEQRIATHNMDVNKQMAKLGLLADPMYEYGNIIPAKTNIVTGETSLAFPAIARDIIGGLLDLANTRRSGVYNPTALMDVAL